MKYAIISDIHGNLEALQSVMEDISHRKVDTILCLGDIVGYYPDPEECVKIVRDNVAYCVAGNHDYAAIGRIDIKTFTYYAFTAMEWTRKNISPETIAFLEGLPLVLQLDKMFLTHSSPSMPEEWRYVFPDNDLNVFEAFNNLTYKLNFIGHTHWPSIMIQQEERIILHAEHSIQINEHDYYLVNVGSVGQPRDFDSRSCYALYDTDLSRVDLIRVEYDFTTTQKKIIDKSLPIFLAERLEKGR